MFKKSQPDYFLLVIILILIIWGIFTVATVSFSFSLKKYGTAWRYLLHQLYFGLIPGLIIGFAFFKIKIENLKKISAFLFGLNLMLLLFVFLPKIGVRINGSRRWLKLGHIFFQPSEFLKITFILYLSAWLSSRVRQKTAKKKNWQAPFVFLLTLAGLGIIFILQPDLSTLIIIALTGTLIYFVSSTPWWHSLLIGLSEGGLALILVKMAPYRINRILTFLNPQSDPLGKGYQLKQSLIAVGSGKLFGVGGGFNLGLSRQKFGFLLQPMTDSIFSVIGEELGFLGAVFLVSLFLAFAWRGIKVSLRSKSEFSRLLGLGIVSWITFQAFFNIGGIIGILPLAGIPLPFFSYGSSHLIGELAGAGILLNISRGP